MTLTLVILGQMHNTRPLIALWPSLQPNPKPNPNPPHKSLTLTLPPQSSAVKDHPAKRKRDVKVCLCYLSYRINTFVHGPFCVDFRPVLYFTGIVLYRYYCTLLVLHFTGIASYCKLSPNPNRRPISPQKKSP